MLRVISVKKSLVEKKKVFCVMAGMSPIGKDGIVASYEVAKLLDLNQVSCLCGISDSSSVAIGNPEWHVRKASHHGSKQQ